MLSIKGLHKFFNKGRQNEIHVLNNIDLDLPERGMLAIFGKSGCGKTTLLNVIGGLDKFAEGRVSVEGFDITENTDTVRNKYIGYIFQNYNLNSGESCFDNVANALRLCGMTDEDEIFARVMAALSSVGMDKYAKRTPDTLSGGQQQRIAIARAIVKNPKIILADEPTGNLDETNTVMIMDLLREIANDHLVLLVTHESDLVDHYCDRVIELADGAVVRVRDNASVSGYGARDKNSIYLGELEKREIVDGAIQAEYYGDAPEEPIKLKIINRDGRLFVKFESEKIRLLDNFSEVKLYDGVFEEKEHIEKKKENIDPLLLTPIKGENYGRLFGFKQSVVSGYRTNFAQGKKRRLMRVCIGLFAAVIVFMTAFMGTAIGDMIDARNAYNHNVFYLYTVDSEVSGKLSAAVGDKNTGIDYIRLNGSYTEGDDQIYFRAGSFESFEVNAFAGDFSTNAVFLDVSLAKDLKLVEGKKDGLENRDLVITTAVADALLEKSNLGYIKERDDLLGLISNAFTIDGLSPRIAGIVECDEPAIYLTEIAMAKYVRASVSPSLVTLASDYGIELERGEVILAVKELRQNIAYPNVGESILIQGIDVTVNKVITSTFNYGIWLNNSGIEKLDIDGYFTETVKSEYPDISPDSEEFFQMKEELMKERYFEYYDYYYSDISGFIGNIALFDSGNIDAWLYFSKGIETAKYTYTTEEYYKACVYKEKYGRYPTRAELAEVSDELPELNVTLSSLYVTYEEEHSIDAQYNDFGWNTYMVSDADYIAMSKRFGKTHPSALESGANDVVYEEICYTVIHSSDPEATEKWLKENFGHIEAPNRYTEAMLTPDMVFGKIIMQSTVSITASLITLVIMLVLMSICMYFIMRSSLIVRIKEIGIFRAIGVSRRNLVFKFFVEALVLATLTSFVGYLISSAFIYTVLGASSAATEMFFYPVPMALAVLVFIYGVNILFGILPILLLLCKTPSQILAKYDI